MDYGGAYGVGMLNTDERLEFVTKEIQGGQLAWMGAPVWSLGGSRLAYLGWHERPRRMAFMEAFDTTTGCFDRIWESKEYPKPAH